VTIVTSETHHLRQNPAEESTAIASVPTNQCTHHT
jgi:hypothetical protein